MDTKLALIEIEDMARPSTSREGAREAERCREATLLLARLRLGAIGRPRRPRDTVAPGLERQH